MESHPIKVVRVLSRMNIGGPALHAILLTAGLNKAQYQSILVTGIVGESEGDMLYLAHQYGVKPTIIPELGREISWSDDLVALWKLHRILVKERPDIVHTHTAKAGALGRIAAALARVPVTIHTFHGHVFHHYFSPWQTRLFLAIERILAHITTKFVAISDTQLADLSDQYRIAGRDKFSVIPIGLDLTPLLHCQQQPGRAALGLEKEEIVLGFVGRLVPIKNPLMAIKVVEQLARDETSVSRFRLVVAGDGELGMSLREQVKKDGLDGLVRFTGWRQNSTELYDGVDLVILTSLNEGTPVVLIEAMAAGLPFVATKVGGVADLMTGTEQVIRNGDGRPLFSLFANGALVESGDEEGFTAAVKYLAMDRDSLKRMGSEGRRFVMGRFSKERLLQDVEALYCHCLGR